MTDTERQICERIATAMGWVRRHMAGDCRNALVWEFPDGRWDQDPPNYFTEPDAADALFDWLRDSRAPQYRVTMEGYESPCGRGWVIIIVSDYALAPAVRAQDPDWKTSLANAAGKAIEEAGK